MEAEAYNGAAKALLDAAPPLYCADAGGNLVFHNDAFDKIAPALFGDDDAADPTRQGAVVAAPRALLEVFNRLNAVGQALTLRHCIIVDGKQRYYRSHHFQTAGETGFTGYGGSYVDLTTEIDAVMPAADATSPIPIPGPTPGAWTWEADKNLKLTYLSDALVARFDIPDSLPFGESLGGGNFLLPFRDRVLLVPDRSARVCRLSLSGFPVFDPGTGECTGYKGTAAELTRDGEGGDAIDQGVETMDPKTLAATVSHLREQNTQLETALTEARFAIGVKTEFLGKMSHELRTPLNAIIGFSEISIQQSFGTVSPRYLGYFRDIHGAANHLLSIINDILDAANVDSSNLAISIQPVRLSEVLAEAKSILAVRAEQAKIDTSLVILSDEWVVAADPGRTRQILVNLLGNAVKFTKPGGSIGVEALEAGDDVEITVWDTGVGIPADQHGHIFESFHQLDSDILCAPAEGTGLGLTISRQLARLMGGDIAVDSEPGRGARFTVRLPKSEPAGAAEA